MRDFIIVGHGLAACALMHSFKKHGISFTAIGEGSLSSCSRIAGGIWNPVVFKRATKSWLADELIPELLEFYGECESLFGEKILTQRPILKPFTEDQEKKLWLKKSRTGLEDFLDECIVENPGAELEHCRINNGYGVVKQSGSLNLALFIDLSLRYFSDHVVNAIFDHDQLQVSGDGIIYKDVSARNIVFCEGTLVKNNPYFKWVPLKPAKGEILTLDIPGLKFRDLVFNKNGFLMDTGVSTYRCGATYEWQQLDEMPTEKGLKELEAKLHEMIDCDYRIIKHEAGVRPSSADRRPLIGSHPVNNRLYIFNGLGTKGVMLAPYFAKKFVFFYLQKEALHPAVDLARFYHLYEA